MLDKIKVNLSYYVYNTILQDMVRFEFFKPNGDVNRNEFLNCIIYNFYQNKLKKREKLKEELMQNALLTDISNKNKQIMLNSAIKIMDDFYNEDISYRYHHLYFMIYPTKQTNNFFNDIYQNEIKNTVSISSFIRRLLNEYASLPQCVRENIAKREEAIKLHTACTEKNVIYFFVSGHEYKLAPFDLVINREETYTYLIGIDLNSKKQKPISIKLSKIYNITISKEEYKFTKQQHEEIMNIIMNGVEFASGDMVKVKIKVTEAGIKMLEFKTHNRPNIININNDIYEVSCTISNFINYFISFGKEIKVVDNEDIKNRMRKFYSLALKNMN